MAAPPLSPAEAERWTRIGALAALAMLLGYLESFLPIPLPGVKLGLANIAVLLALEARDVPGACWVAATKVVATGLLFGNPVTLAYSAAGTLLSIVLMASLSQLPTMRIEMVSVVGALAHEAGQLLVAQALLGTPLVWYSAPLLAVAGCATGLLCGIVARRAAHKLQAATTSQPARSEALPTPGQLHPSPAPGSGKRDVVVLVLYLLLVVASMHATTASALGACLTATSILCLVARTELRSLWRALAPVVPIALITIVAQIANAQQGTVLLQLGPIALTHEALESSAVMLGRLTCITLASVALVNLIGRAGLARCARQALCPLKALGCNTAGPELALATTLQLLPLLAETLGEEIRPRDIWTRHFWHERLPQLVTELYRETSQQDLSAEGHQS